MAKMEDFRAFFGELLTANVGIAERNGRLSRAIAATAREDFIGKGPWKVFTPVGYIQTPSDDPRLLYQDTVVAIDAERQINNGQPTLHVFSLSALNVQERERVIHIGAGTGYYTAVLARLVGPEGSVVAFEVEKDLADRATRNLSDFAHVEVLHRSGAIAPLNECDVIYVSAGATRPMDVWLDALRPGGRLLFPLTPAEGMGGMLMITHVSAGDFAAKFLSHAMFIPCVGARDDDTAQKLSTAFSRGDMWQVKSLRRHSPPDGSCWVAGENWWLSKA